MRVRIFAAVMVVAVLSACGEVNKPTDTADEPAQLVTIDGSERQAIVLTSAAAQRLAIETAAVAPAKTGQTVIPHAAVFYGLDGEAWTYASPEELTYLRTPISIDRIEGDRAYLTDGPPPGTQVVTVGAPELFGVEEGVGH
jgi:hypothetical protein